MVEHRTATILFVILCMGIASFAQDRHQLSPDERQHVLDGDFRIISTTDGIPPQVRKAFCEIARQQSFAMANPGQKYQVGDVIFDRNLPRRRLVFAGASKEKWFIHYERGGRGVGHYILVFKVDSRGDTQFLWGGAGTGRAQNLEQLRKMVAGGQLSDAANYYW
jgi:hypothetical protein